MKKVKIIKAQRKPLRFLLSRILWHTGMGKFITINLNRYKIRFFPTALSASMWLNPADRREDDIFFEAYLQQGDILIDVGANIGTVALASSALVGPSGKVFAFEPHSRIFKYMNKNIRLNGYANIETFNMALGERERTLTLSNNYSDDQNRVQMDRSTGHFNKIQVKCLDTILANRLSGNDRIAMLKIDVEGFEKFVIEGALNIISRCDCVYFESYDVHFRKYGYSSNDLLKMLCSLGFVLYKKNGVKLQPISLPYFSTTCENLVALRKKELDVDK